jgi:hypothetical protein
MDDDNWAKPNEVSTYVRAMEWGGADVMTSFVDFFWSADERPPLESESFQTHLVETKERPSS